MHNANGLGEQSAIELAEAVRSGRLTAVDVVSVFLDRIQTRNETLNAFVYVDADGALEAAHEIDSRITHGEAPGTLSGVPFGIKDFTNCRGMPTSHGSRALHDGKLQLSDDPIIARLRAAGAIPIGKTNVPEFGVHSATYNELFGITRNPWNLERTPGGSSGGSSAAVSGGLVPFATGSDGGGSIRTPAAFCNLVGMKTTHALIPRESGNSPLSCLGFLTTTVADTARLIDVTAGAHPIDKMSLTKPNALYENSLETSDVSGLRAAWSADLGYAPVEPEIIEIARRAYERLADTASLVNVDRDVRLNNVYRDWIIQSLNFLADELSTDGLGTDLFDERTQGLLARFSKSAPSEHINVQKNFAALERQAASLFNEIDLLFTPATACAPIGADAEVPDRIAGQDATWTGVEPFSMFANVAWLPAISIPAGLTSDGLPVGLQIVGRRHEDATLLRLARIMEQSFPWTRHAPTEGHRP